MHRPTGETVLMYGFTDPQRTREIQYVLVQMGIRVKNIHDDQLGQTVIWKRIRIRSSTRH